MACTTSDGVSRDNKGTARVVGRTCCNSESSSSLTFPELLQRIDDTLADGTAALEDVHALLQAYVSKRSDWKKYAHFDSCKYTRNLVLEGTEKFNLVLLCWGEGQASGIHDHADSDCFVKVLDGELEEIRYSWPEKDGDVPKRTEVFKATTNDVMYMHDRLGLHRVLNPSHSKRAVSLHLYSPPFDTCGSYCERTGLSRDARMTWYSKAGRKVDACSEIRKKMGMSG